jgi:hypothetical protein
LTDFPKSPPAEEHPGKNGFSLEHEGVSIDIMELIEKLKRI